MGAVALLVLTGVAYTLYTSNTNALVQLSAPGYLQGRVAGLYSYIFSGSSALGALVAGGLAHLGGTQLAFFVAGGTALACSGFGAIMRRTGITAELPETQTPQASAVAVSAEATSPTECSGDAIQQTGVAAGSR
jgi:MFS family permease